MENVTQPQATTTAPATVSETPASAPSTASSPVMATTEAAAPAAATSSTSEASKTETSAITETPTPAENILGDEKKPEVKTEEKKIDETQKPEGEKPAEKEVAKETKTETKAEEKPLEKPSLPVFEDYKLPENFTADKETISELNKILGEAENAKEKLDHKAFQEAGQKLVDLAIKNTQTTIDRYTQSLIQQHNKTGDEWLAAFKKDPVLAGDNITETISTLQDAVGRFAGNEAQVKEFRDLMVNTNVGKHPALIRMIKNMNDKIRSYESETKQGMVPAAKPAPQKVKAHELFYSHTG